MVEYAKLKNIIDEVKGATFAGIDTRTVVKLKGGKKNPMQGRLFKVTTDSNVILFSNVDDNPYEKMVKRRMVSEGKDPESFTVKPRAWGVRENRSPFITHNDKHYLECFFRSAGNVSYELDDGTVVDPSTIQGYETPTISEESAEKSQGGIEDKVIVRTFSLDSIQAIRLKNTVLEETN